MRTLTRHSPGAIRTPPEGCEVHVWSASLDVEASELSDWKGILSEDERARASRYRFIEDRDRFVARRGLLRSILGRYLRRDASTIRFAYGPQGKPSLAPGFEESALEFNVAHSGPLALLAVAQGRRVGVDVELIRPGWRDLQIAERFFAPAEAAEIHALPLDARAEAFFRCWTGKEAYVKARGEGLSIPLREFRVSVVSGNNGAPDLIEDCSGTSPWSLVSLELGPGVVGALVVEGTESRLRYCIC